jgi:uncharacterized protein (TIGR03437 family)
VTTLPTANGWIIVTAAYNGQSKGVLFVLTAAASSSPVARITSMTCLPRTLTAGSHGSCRVTLDSVQNSSGVALHVSTSSGALRLPERVLARRGQRTVEFQIDAADAAESIDVTAALGQDTVTEVLRVAPDRSQPIHVPGRQFVKHGTELRFAVSAADPSATLKAGILPSGAQFDPDAGEFRWTPVSSQTGTYEIEFTALNAATAKATATVTVDVDSGEPVVTGIVNAASRSKEAACSPGAIATIEGRWLQDAKVWANGIAVPVLAASETGVDILCPDAVAGSELSFTVSSDFGGPKVLRTISRSAAPGLFSLDGTGAGQALALVEDSSKVAMAQNYRIAAQPALAGERIRLYATGIDRLSNVSVRVGEAQIAPTAIRAVGERPGLFEVIVTLPETIDKSGEILLSLSGNAESTKLQTNVLSIVVDPAVQ